MIVVHKDYTLDYTTAMQNVIMETEYEADTLTYRYVYGLEKAHIVIYGIQSGVGDLTTIAVIEKLHARRHVAINTKLVAHEVSLDSCHASHCKYRQRRRRAGVCE